MPRGATCLKFVLALALGSGSAMAAPSHLPTVQELPPEFSGEDLVAWIIPKDVLSLCFSTLGIT